MFRKLIAQPLFYTLVIGGIVLGVLVCIFPHYIPSLSWGVNYAVHIMLFYFFAGILMLFLRMPRLTFAFFGGCAFLCIFLKYSVKSDGILHATDVPTKYRSTDPPSEINPSELKIAHLTLTNADSLAEVLDAIRAAEADMVSIHEVTPDWAEWLEDSLASVYPNYHTMMDIGIFGMAIYSKHPLVLVDTFHYQEIPNLRGCVEKNGESVCFISVHTEPALNSYSLQRLEEHLEVVGGYVIGADMPVVVMGDFNAVAWSDEIKSFLKQSNLMESRIGFMPFPFIRPSSLFEVPLDHIFYSQELQCTSFENINGPGAKRLGISGVFSRKLSSFNAKKTAQ